MNKISEATELFREGCACSQAILAVYGQPLGLSRDLAMRIAAGFAGGMRMGETCGAVTGALPTDLNNVCTVPETDTCPDYQYMYKRVTIFDELGRIGHDALNVIEGGEEIINDIVNFFKKYGLYFAIGLFVLVAIPLVVAIVKKL